MLHSTLSRRDDRNGFQEEDGTAAMKVFESTLLSDKKEIEKLELKSTTKASLNRP
jgi:hypothetical protein